MANTSINIKELTDLGLIECIEHPAEALKHIRDEALRELKDRALSEERIRELAIAINEDIAYKLISLEPLSEDDVALHESAFLNEKELKEIYLTQLEKYMEYRDQFRYDVWAHLIDPK